MHAFQAAGAEALGNDGCDVFYGIFICVRLYQHPFHAAAGEANDAL